MMNISNGRIAFPRSRFVSALLAVSLLAAGYGTVAEARYDIEVPGARWIEPEKFGFNIPDGPVTAGDDRRVLTADEFGHPVVGQVYVQVGDNFIVLLPDGQLVPRMRDKAELTERPFQPLTADEIAAQLTQPGSRLHGFRHRKTRHHLFIYNTSDPFLDATVRILDSMYGGMQNHVRSFQITPTQPIVPMVVIMFRSEAQFQAYEPMPPGVLAYYNMGTNHIVLHEESPLTGVSRELAIGQSLSTIAHEGAHQILHNIGVQQRLSVWPMWLAEGMAEYYAPTEMTRTRRWKGAGQINDLRMLELEAYLQRRSIQGIDGTTLRDTVGSPRLDSSGYAAAWALTHFLANRYRDQWRQIVKFYSALGPLQGMHADGPIEDNRIHFQETFAKDFAVLEQEMITHLTRQRYESPLAAFPHFVTTVEFDGLDGRQRRASMFHSREMASVWAIEFRDHLSDNQRAGAQFQMYEFPNREAANQFVRRWLR